MASRRGCALDGVLLLDKPEGLSSNHALQRARRILDARKAGHTGTLDPFATGLMVLCFGEATKFSADMFHADKTYVADVVLREETDTGDRTGLPVTYDGQVVDAPVDEEKIRAVLSRFVGSIDQLPPMYSALKRDGKPLYEYARQGIELERETRRITIFSIQLLSCTESGFSMEVSCSKGTYIRTLAQDIGRMLGCGAHLGALRRTRTAGFDISQAVTLEGLEALTVAATALMPIEALLAPLPVVTIDQARAAKFMQGQKLQFETAGQTAGDANTIAEPDAETILTRARVHGPDSKFLGTARCIGGWLQPDRLISFKETT
jgi:tRNA pseudouridine55 synthase